MDGIGHAPLAAFLLALLGSEVTLARILRSMNVIIAAEAIDFLPSALGSSLDMPASFVGADEVTFALGADPLVGDRVELETLKIGLCRLRSGVDERHVKLVCGTAPGVSDKIVFLR